jgi:hypothetical protein
VFKTRSIGYSCVLCSIDPWENEEALRGRMRGPRLYGHVRDGDAYHVGAPEALERALQALEQSSAKLGTVAAGDVSLVSAYTCPHHLITGPAEARALP